tara:strand:- start:1749 stop:2240 length:492 start_codon:yes stop_codon:yes gene_type:complete
MPEVDEIIEGFSQRIIDGNKFYSQYGKATDVNEATRTCTFLPANDEGETFDVRFQALMSQTTGIVIVPKEGSDIAVSFINKNTGFIALTTEVEKILIDTDLVQFNGGNNGGLVNVDYLLTKVNDLETKVNIISTWAATVTPPLTTAPLSLTLKNNLEDEKVKH